MRRSKQSLMGTAALALVLSVGAAEANDNRVQYFGTVEGAFLFSSI